jgi:hypothetical protein
MSPDEAILCRVVHHPRQGCRGWFEEDFQLRSSVEWRYDCGIINEKVSGRKRPVHVNQVLLLNLSGGTEKTTKILWITGCRVELPTRDLRRTKERLSTTSQMLYVASLELLICYFKGNTFAPCNVFSCSSYV